MIIEVRMPFLECAGSELPGWAPSPDPGPQPDYLIIEVWMPFNKSRVHRGMLDLSFQAGLQGWILDPSPIT